MQNEEQKRIFLAMALSAVVLFLWQFFFVPKVAPKKIIKKEVTEQPIEKIKTEDLKPKVKVKSKISEFALGEQKISLNNQLHFFNFTSSHNKFPFNSTVGVNSPFKIMYIANDGPREINMFFRQSDTNTLIGEDSSLGIKISISYDEESDIYNFKLNSNSAKKIYLEFNSLEKEENQFLKREFLLFKKEVIRESIDDDFSGDGAISWAGIDFNHHLFAVSFKNKETWRYTSLNNKLVLESGGYLKALEGSFVYTIKNYNRLKGLKNNLHQAVDFGFFSILAVPILNGLQWFYSKVPNYGIAIIFLTILLRIFLFPLQYKSVKSMKKMQLIQPELNKIKEKYENDPQKVQQESMELFKRSGANPLSGCLPLILQMPIFIAFYKVLYSSVELVGAPFALWSLDLSKKDPYFVLPILMTVSMMLQQKMTPTATVDPMQKKMMLFMPLFFGFIMKDLPSGLVLYMFVSTLLGILQQVIVQKRVS